MPYELFDHVLPNGHNDFQEWTSRLQIKERAKLNEKIDKLLMEGEALRPVLLSDCGESGIYKLRIQGGVKLRPRLCRGPIQVDAEYTFLAGAKEVQSKDVPSNANQLAKDRKVAIVADPTRRVEHEKVA